MMKNLKQLTMAVVALLAVMAQSACQKMILDEEDSQPTGGNVVIKASLYNIVPFDTRAGASLTEYCSTIQFIFYQNGSKVKYTNQKQGTSGYGQASFTLEPGTYQLLVLAHSCPYGNPTVSDPAEIHFSNTGSGYSDTFYYYGSLDVTADPKTHEVRLERAVSMVSLTITDEIPSNVSTIALEYEGESGVFNAVTGWGGTTNSEQKINYNVKGYSAPVTLKAYTFLRGETGTLTMTVTAKDGDGSVIAEKKLENIPMQNRMVTEYSGRLFSSSESEIGIHLTADTEWQVYKQFTF